MTRTKFFLKCMINEIEIHLHQNLIYLFSQSLSRVWLFVTPWTAAHQASLFITSFRSPLKPMSTESEMPSNHLILCRPLLILSSVFPNIRVFSKESILHIRWPKYWSFSFSISPSNEYSGLKSFRMDWLDFLAVQGILKSLLQHHSSKASILRHSRKLPRTIIEWTRMYIPHDLIKNINHKSLQSYLTLCNPMDCSLPGSSVHGILQTRILEWVVMTFSRGSFPAKDWIHVSYVSCIGRWVLYL